MEHLEFVNKLNDFGISVRSTNRENHAKEYNVPGVNGSIKISVKGNKCDFVDYVTFTGSEPLPMLIAKQIDRGSWKHSWHNNVYDSSKYPAYLNIIQEKMIEHATAMDEMLTVYFLLKSEIERTEAKGSANFNINQQAHGGQSVSQPAPNPQERTSPC